MVSIDQRTRIDGEHELLDLEDFFDVQLPALAAERSHLAVPGALELGVEPFTFDTPAGAWTMSVADDRVVVDPRVGRHRGPAPGRERAHRHRARPAHPDDPAHRRQPDHAAGDLGDALDWWVVLRSLLDGRAAHTRGSVTFRDRDGDPLDLHRSFDVDDDPAELAHFLAEAGFLHLRGVFTEEEMAEVSDDMDAAAGALRARRRPLLVGPHRRRASTSRCGCSTSTSTALAPPRCWTTTGSCASGGSPPTGTGPAARGTGSRRCSSPSASSRGSPTCPGTRTAASAGTRTSAAGSPSASPSPAPTSARASWPSSRDRTAPSSSRPSCRREWGLPVIDLPTRTGDVTVHCSCTMHMSHPPIDRERRVMYSGFSMPALDPDAARASLAALGQVREQAHRTVSQAPGHLG